MDTYEQIRKVTLDTQREFMDSRMSHLTASIDGEMKNLMMSKINREIGNTEGLRVARTFAEPLVIYHQKNAEYYKLNHHIKDEIEMGALIYSPLCTTISGVAVGALTFAYHFQNQESSALFGAAIGALFFGTFSYLFTKINQNRAEDKIYEHFRHFEPEIKKIADTLEGCLE